MLSTWGGNNGIDTISQVELDCLGFDTCAKYCKEYCWHYGMGYCGNCAYDKERTKRRDAESKDDENQRLKRNQNISHVIDQEEANNLLARKILGY